MELEKARRQHLRSSFINSSSLTIGRHYHVSAKSERSGPTIVLGFGAVALTAKAAQLIVRAYDEWKKEQPPPPPLEASPNDEKNGTNKSNASDAGEKNKQETQSKSHFSEGKRENIFKKYFNVGVGSNFYEGGFEETMTKREAALILGVRESSTTKRIKEAHRKLLIVNHPDTGGSTYISGKVNEAKDLLLKGRKD